MEITPHTPITVGELRELIAGLDDDLPVRVEDAHAYRPITGGRVEPIGWNTQSGEDDIVYLDDVVFLLSMPFEAQDPKGNEIVFGVRRDAP